MAVAVGRRERTKERNRALILAAGRACFAENGYGGTAVRDIVRRSGLSPGSFYNYFGDKEGIFLALVAESTASIRSRLRSARRSARSLEEFVGVAYHAYFSGLAEDPAMFELLRRNAGTVRAMLDDALVAAGVDELLEDLEGAIARGEIPPIDARYMAHAMAGVGLEVGMEMLDRDPVDVDGAARFASDLFLGGIARMAGVGGGLSAAPRGRHDPAAAARPLGRRGLDAAAVDGGPSAVGDARARRGTFIP